MDQLIGSGAARHRSARPIEVAADLFPRAVRSLAPYVPGASLEEIQLKSSVSEIAKLASNECPLGPTEAAIAAVRDAAPELARYPDGSASRLTADLAERLDLTTDEILVGAGADGCIGNLVSAIIEAGSELICGWPSFPTPMIATQALGGSVTRTPLRDDHHHDLEAMLAAIGPATKIVYICHPNNPTGTANGRHELDAYFDAVPDHVLTVLDQAYFEYVDSADYPDGIDYLRQGHRVAVLRTFSKIYGLAGLRIGYLAGPAAVVAEVRKVQGAFEVSAIAQKAAIASLGQVEEVARRRQINAASRADLIDLLAQAGMPAEPGAVANFVFVKPAIDADRLARDLLTNGVAIRPLRGFGAADHVRITVGTPRDHALLADGLAAVTTQRGPDR